jgi:hypothetical protein
MKTTHKKNEKGIALLVVLFIVMAVTVISLGFLTRSDVELSCGTNMVLRTQMDYLAESGLEHARGLIINDVNYPASLTGQLQAGSDDYYHFAVIGSDVDPCDPNICSYEITSIAYRDKDGDRVGESFLTGHLYVDLNTVNWTSCSR